MQNRVNCHVFGLTTRIGQRSLCIDSNSVLYASDTLVPRLIQHYHDCSSCDTPHCDMVRVLLLVLHIKQTSCVMQKGPYTRVIGYRDEFCRCIVISYRGYVSLCTCSIIGTHPKQDFGQECMQKSYDLSSSTVRYFRFVGS